MTVEEISSDERTDAGHASGPDLGLDPALDLDLRLIRYFVAVAEHAGFGRAADALHLAQPSLSRQIQRLEHQLGARLLDRTPRGSVLTEAGAAFLPHARALLVQARRAASAAREASAARTFTLGYVGDSDVGEVARLLRARLPGTVVRTRYLDEMNAVEALRDRTVDALIARLPLPAEGLRVVPLHRERRVLAVSTTHPFAGRASLTPGELDGEARVSCGATDATWTSFWRLEDGGAAVPVPLAPAMVETFEDKLGMVAAGEAVAVLSEGDRRIALWPGLATVPIAGVEPVQVVAVSRPGSDARADAFLEVAAEVLGAEAQGAGGATGSSARSAADARSAS
ncbi:LysR family transcriptional regulator [Promicromonospora sp. NPDC057488]|uniref:LysR family transcriptional regulator n=1 Tax=Promicromonospora sp. NPDC057488 TaxID=3346147 RepID=UPI0036705A55